MIKKSTLYTVLLTVIIFLAASGTGWAQTQLVNQDFSSGTIGTAVTASPISWGTNSTGNGTFLIANSSPITYNNYKGGGENYLEVTKCTSNTVNVGPSFSATSGTSTFYYSFLINVSTAPTAENYFAALSTTISSGSYFARLFAKSATGGYNLGIAKGTSTGTYKASPTLLTTGTTYLVIVKYVYVTNTNNDEVYLWINPAITSEPLTSSAEASIATGTDAAALSSNGVFTLRSNTGTPNYSIDGIKVGFGSSSALAWSGLAAYNNGIYSHMLTSGTPNATKQLGDKLNPTGTWYIQYEIGEASWNLSDAGIGKSNTNPASWTWRTANYYQDGTAPNKRVQADFGDFQFTSTGTWYFNGRTKRAAADPFDYANDANWSQSQNFAPAYYFTVNAVTDPAASNAIAISASQINLTWTKDATPHNVMVVRKKSSDSWTEPTQGTPYTVNATLGAGTVVYNGSGASLNDNTGLTAGTSYDYKFYSENYSYYSAGIVSSATTYSVPTIGSFTPDNMCSGSSTAITITGTNFTDATSVTINNTSVSFTVTDATHISATASGVSTGKVAVTTPGGTATSTGNFTVNPLPSAIVTGNNSPICSGNDATFTVTGTTGAVVTYSFDGGTTTATVTLTGGTATVTSAAATTNKTLTLVSVTDGTCPKTLGTTSTVTVNQLPTASITGNNSPICSGNDATFTVTGTTGAVVTYSFDGGTTTATATLTLGTATVTNTAATTNKTLTLVSVTDGTCPKTLGTTSTVTVNQLPTASITGNNSPICSGNDATFTVTGTTGAVVTYSFDGGTTTATVTLTGGTATVTSTAATTNKTLTLVSVTDGTCPKTLGTISSVTVNQLPAAVTVSGGGTSCGSVTITASGGTGGIIYYQGNTSNGTDISDLSTSKVITSNGIYYFRAQSAAGCWGTEGSADVTIVQAPGAAGSISGAATVTEGTNIGYTVPEIAYATSYVWAYTGNNVSITNNGNQSITLNFAIGATSGTLTVYGTNGNSCGNGSTSLPFSITVTPIPPSTTTFTGTGNWSTGNWSNGVPTSLLDAIVDGTVTIDVAAVTKNLTINSGRTVTINAAKSLTVEGSFNNYGGTGGLVINTGGSLIAGNSVDATVKCTFTGGANYHLFCLPVDATIPAHPFFDLAYVDEYLEASGAWNRLTDASSVSPLKGYSINYAATTEKTFTGTIYTSNQPFSGLTASSPGGAGKYAAGWNLIGNPFTAAVSTNNLASWSKSNVDNYIYVWDGTQYMAGPTTTGSGVATTLPGNIVPAMQGFFVHATGAGSITIPAGARTHNTQSFYKSSEAATDALFLTINGNGYEDKAIVDFNPSATAGFDGEYDAYKLFGIDEAPQLYSILPQELAAINTLPSPQANANVPLGLKVGSANTYILTFSGIDSFDPSLPINLYDLKLGTILDLRVNPSYSFTAAPGDAENRFNLSFAAVTGIDKNPASKLRIYTTQQRQVNISTDVLAKGTVYVYSASGQLVATKSLSPGETRLSVRAPGVYMVKVVSGTTVTTGKVVVY